MNPARRPLHEALIARLLCVPYPAVEDYDVWDREGLASLRPYIGNIRPQIDRELPRELRTTPGSLHRMAHWLHQRIFWESSQVRQWIIDGSFSETDAAAVRARFSELPTESTLDWGATADAAALAAGLVYYTATATPEIAHELHALLAARAKDDVTGEIGRVLAAYYKTPDATLSTEGWPTESREEYHVRLEKAQQSAAKKAGFSIGSKSDAKEKPNPGEHNDKNARSAA